MDRRPQDASRVVSPSAKPNLLFVTPWTPRPTGSGPAMRAYYSLRALSENYAPHVLVVGVYDDFTASPPKDLAAKWKRIGLSRWDLDLHWRCALYAFFPQRYFARFKMPSESRFASKRRLALAAEAFAGVEFDLIHVYRLYAASYACPYIEASPQVATQLDLDEVESSTRLRLADLCETNGVRRKAELLRYDADAYSQIEKTQLPKWDHVLVASSVEKDRLGTIAAPARVDVLPNVVPVVALRPQREHRTFRFLFIGQLGYVPNEDGLRWFLREVWPLIQGAKADVALDVVGAGASRDLTRLLRATPGVRFMGRVETLDELYASAGAVIVPLRAGGGTRIKILEAFARGVPVIATTIGAEGLAVTPERNLLVADSADEFAEACLGLSADRELCESLRTDAHRLCQDRYQPQAMTDVLATRTESGGAASHQ